MKLSSSNSPLYLPEENQTTVLRLGLQPLEKEDWIYIDDALPIFYRHKTQLRLQHESECFQALAESKPAQEEFHDFLLRHLLEKTETTYQLTGHTLHDSNGKLSWQIENKDLWQASLWIADDFCLLEKISNEYIMTAASVCSPSNWKLEEKIGTSIDAIHAPVPGYADALSTRVRKLMDGLKPHKVVMRFNWSIQKGNELFWRSDLEEMNSANEKFWRIERQTLLRLPHTNAIAFGIRIFLHRFSVMPNKSGFNQAIAQILQQLPSAEKAYKCLI
ncbi:MAG: DUF3445 domain-containing protein [Pseudohongiella sp.]|nr:DUF3445 domain-containing protein [Pseudohongiella sp.]